jgi:hypothetical protein
MVILGSLQGSIGYRPFNKPRADGLFWYYKSGICTTGKESESLSLALHVAEGVIYSGLTSLYLYLGYYCYRYKVDPKYLTLNIFAIPTALIVVGIANVILISNSMLLVDYYDTITNVVQLLLVLVITCGDLITLRETRAIGSPQTSTVSRFRQDSEGTILSRVWNQVRGCIGMEGSLNIADQSNLPGNGKGAKIASKRVTKISSTMASLIAELESTAMSESKTVCIEGSAVRSNTLFSHHNALSPCYPHKFPFSPVLCLDHSPRATTWSSFYLTRNVLDLRESRPLLE